MGQILLFIDRLLDIDDRVSNVTSTGHQCLLLEVTAFLRLFCDRAMVILKSGWKRILRPQVVSGRARGESCHRKLSSFKTVSNHSQLRRAEITSICHVSLIKLHPVWLQFLVFSNIPPYWMAIK